MLLAARAVDIIDRGVLLGIIHRVQQKPAVTARRATASQIFIDLANRHVVRRSMFASAYQERVRNLSVLRAYRIEHERIYRQHDGLEQWHYA